ncbi:constitutive coactivator of peroxisome proliferator-activated receptor gamma [Caerostris extrusa]|uniref:Constitutive coactivator of peroxisome proliferator-activated receptor gamma n=1 Tax=Caerostris extrusa TaxID=172846 RepID=A0AAV4R2A7_CAEEX|nr:constitutive coactivator of peroxisome proliferator-activated receptor gamma [Caerostris extrusa]
MYLSLSHLNIDTLQTIHYDRQYFAEHYLKLYVKQLPLFACLAGNDFIPFDKLRQFHRSISNQQRIYLSTIAENLCRIIRNECWTGDLNSRHELDHISRFVFGNNRFSNLIYEGLKSYMFGNSGPPPSVCISVNPNMEKAVYEKHSNCFNSPYIFNLLCKLEYESSEVLEDDSRLPTALVYREIRQRCYGVLFNQFLNPKSHGKMHTKDENSVIVKEWCAYKGNLLKSPEFIKPLPLNAYPFTENENTILSIEDLWFKCTEIEKLKLFGPLLKPFEVAVFITQALWKSTSEELKQLLAPSVDAVAVNLSTLFMRGVTTVLMVLNICDFPFPMTHAMPWRFFDGKLFHYLHNKAKLRPSIQDLCKNEDKKIKDFYNLLPYVISNTVYDFHNMDWKTIFPDFEYPL